MVIDIDLDDSYLHGVVNADSPRGRVLKRNPTKEYALSVLEEEHRTETEVGFSNRQPVGSVRIVGIHVTLPYLVGAVPDEQIWKTLLWMER